MLCWVNAQCEGNNPQWDSLRDKNLNLCSCHWFAMDITDTEAMCSEWKTGAEHFKMYSPENHGCWVATSLAFPKTHQDHGFLMLVLRRLETSGPIPCLLKRHLVIEILWFLTDKNVRILACPPETLAVSTNLSSLKQTGTTSPRAWTWYQAFLFNLWS